MGLCKRSIRKLSLPGWLRVLRLGAETVTRCLLGSSSGDGGADSCWWDHINEEGAQEAHTDHAPYPGDTGPTGHSPPRSITHNTLWAWAGRRGLNVHKCSLYRGLWNTIAKVRHFWGWCFPDETFPWDIWISCMWMHTVTHKSFLWFKVKVQAASVFV